MNIQKVSLDDFRPLVEAIEEQEAAATAFYEKCGAARELLDRIASRQDKGAEEVSAMLEELRREEAALRRKVREDTSRRAKARISGQQPPEMDNSAGARLAAIPDERAALEAMMTAKEMTPEEREEWKTLHADARSAGDRLKAANRAVTSELIRWRGYFADEARRAALSVDDSSLDSLVREAYELNSKAVQQEEDDEEEDSADGEDWTVAYGRKAD